MRYKTLFRLLVKAVGVLIIAEGVAYFLAQIAYVFAAINNSPRMSLETFHPLLYPAIKVAFGLYLLLDGGWFVNRAIPSNRPYCGECGYELTGNAGGRCPECGTPIAAELPIPAGSVASASSCQSQREKTEAAEATRLP